MIFVKISLGFMGILSAIMAHVVFHLKPGKLWDFSINWLVTLILYAISIFFVTSLVKDKKPLYYISAALVFVVLGLLASVPIGISFSYYPKQSLLDLIIPLYGILLIFPFLLGFLIHRNYKKRPQS